MELFEKIIYCHRTLLMSIAQLLALFTHQIRCALQTFGHRALARGAEFNSTSSDLLNAVDNAIARPILMGDASAASFPLQSASAREDVS